MIDLESILKVEIKSKKDKTESKEGQKERRRERKNEEQTRHVGARKMNQYQEEGKSRRKMG